MRPRTPCLLAWRGKGVLVCCVLRGTGGWGRGRHLVDRHPGGFFEAGDGGEEDYGFVAFEHLPPLAEVDGCDVREVEGAEEVYV
jgi:hypothetical protein